MRPAAVKKAIGIDISKSAVSFAELQRVGSQIKVLRYATCPISAIDGKDIFYNPALIKSLKKFKMARLFHENDAVLTVCAEPVLLQIFDLPDSAPGEVKKIIQNEIRQYAVLPLKNVEMDYCGLRTSDNETKRVLVGAGQSEYLTAAVRAVEKSSVKVRAVEPAITAFIRACFDKVIQPAGKKNIMLLLVRDDTLYLCVFEKQKLEFLRTKKLETGDAQQLSVKLKDEIESVIQFYELEKETKSQSWQIIIAGLAESQDQTVNEIRNQFNRQDLEITSFENSLLDAAVIAKGGAAISPVAVGAAMKLIDEGERRLNLNLLPGKIISARRYRNQLLIISNIAAVLLVIMLLTITLLTKKTINVSNNLNKIKLRPKADFAALVESKKEVDDKIQFIERNNSIIDKTMGGKKYHNWAKMLVEFTRVMPNTVLMEDLDSKDDGSLKIKGLAINYESANKFVNLLEQNKKISSASLVSAGQSGKYNGLIEYSILCALNK